MCVDAALDMAPSLRVCLRTQLEGVCVEAEYTRALGEPDITIAMARWTQAQRLRVMIFIAGKARVLFHWGGQSQCHEISSSDSCELQTKILDIDWNAPEA